MLEKWKSGAKKKKLMFLGAVLLLAVALAVSVESVYTLNGTAEQEGYVVVIDPGHGGFDPGKVGVGDVLEKDINLSISLKLKKLLEQNDVTVILTRDQDVGLDKVGESTKKSSDMKNRVKVVNEAGADLAVSIHQNSFTKSSSRGAQVFYYTKSEESKELAEILQKQLKATMDDGNQRMAKSNDTYYVLKQTEGTIAIIECGFLTNPEEAALLMDESYQEKIAWAIHLGIMQYLNQNGKDVR